LSRSATRRRGRPSTTRARSSITASDLTAGIRRATALTLALALASVLALVGCGSDDETTPTTATTDAERTDAGTPETGDGTGGIELEKIGEFDAPLYVTQPADDGDDIYVVEQAGTIERVTPSGDQTTFLDISDEVVSGGEQGLLSMAFAPDYSRTGRFYVDYTNTDGDTRVVEYTAKDGVVDESSARELLAVDQPYPNHNGGLVLFGPDGDLYIGLGDGGAGGDPERRGLDLSTLLGKILRIDPTPDGKSPYAVPDDNPFVDRRGARPEIYSYGLRNPWRFSFDRESGDLTIGDVGQDAEEEIDVVGRGEGSGANFGWSAYEGNQRFNDDQSAPDAIPPALVALHSDGTCSITGGLVVRDPDLTSLYGRYLYGDLCLGQLRSFTPQPGAPAKDDTALGVDVERLASFGEGVDGTVYAASISGPVYRLAPAR
jgi:glucose/arabinose dehydrogenase